jgi:glycosyltransferase involved in cell wall biosynthesis
VRVLFSLPHTIGAPGIGTAAMNEVRGLAEQGVDVELYVTSVAGELPPGVRVTRTMHVGSRRVPHRALGIRRTYAYHDWRTARALTRLGSSIDLVHCWPAATVKTAAAARQAGVVSLREMPSPHTADAMRVGTEAARALGVELPKRDPHRFDAKKLALEEREFRAVDFLLAPADCVAASLMAHGFPAQVILRHQYGFDESRFGPGELPEEFTVAFVGRGAPLKGLDLALRAWIDSGACEQGKFLICGSIIPGYRELLAPLLAHSSVEQLGFVSDVPSVLRRAHVLVLPSLTEGSALVTYEAQGSGCVLVVSDEAGAMITDGEQGLVHHAGDLATLTEHLRLLSTDRELLARMRAATLRHREALTWSRAGARLAEVYREALERGPAARSTTLL